MKMQPYVSLCIPTNGVVEWIFPVLDSIYYQGIDDSLFEVVITDNGNNDEFKRLIHNFKSKHKNLVYTETDALPFINEIESYKIASGKLIKFVNHRTKLVKGALQKLVDYSKNYSVSMPITYFSNGVLEKKKRVFIYDSFDQFVKNLSYWSSWSTGMTIWKEDFDKLSKDVSKYNETFPHTNVLFNERNRGKYIIDNTVIFDEIPQEKKPKGNYDLFFAFGVEYPWIICNLLREKDITIETFKYVADKNLGFIAEMYYLYCVRKHYCSYDLRGLNNMFGVFYSKSDLMSKLVSEVVGRAKNKIMRKKND